MYGPFNVAGSANAVIKGSGTPTEETAARPGQRYLDVAGQKEYVCVHAEDGVYTWACTTADELDSGSFIPLAQKGVNGGVATLNSIGKIPLGQIPALEYDAKGAAQQQIENHDNDENAHEFLREKITKAQETAEKALKSITELTFTIEVLPSQSNTLKYNGSTQEPEWDNYNPDTMEIGGVLSATSAGTYAATFTPRNHYQWSDGTTTAKNIYWKISKAVGTLTTDQQSLVIDKENLSVSFTIGGNHDGTIQLVSNDTSVATVSKSGNTVTVSHVNQTTGSTSITVSCSEGTNYTAPASINIPVSAKFVAIYGAEWDGTATTAWSRTDASADFIDPVPAIADGDGSSPFDDLYPWNGMQIVEDEEAGTLVSIPKFWYKWTKNGDSLKLQIADGPVDGFYVSPAHADRGDGKGERDVVYVGRYHCSSTDLKSTTGEKPKTGDFVTGMETKVHNLGETIWHYDYALRTTIQLLYLVEFANWNSREVIGAGCSSSSSTTVNNGKTDSLAYHTGTTGKTRESYGHTQYRHIEGLWDNVDDWIGYARYSTSGLVLYLNPGVGSSKIVIGVLSSGYPTEISLIEAGGVQWFYPSKSGGSKSTYIPDYWMANKLDDNPYIHGGGSFKRSSGSGMFYVNYKKASATDRSFIGSRLQKLP